MTSFSRLTWFSLLSSPFRLNSLSWLAFATTTTRYSPTFTSLSLSCLLNWTFRLSFWVYCLFTYIIHTNVMMLFKLLIFTNASISTVIFMNSYDFILIIKWHELWSLSWMLISAWWLSNMIFSLIRRVSLWSAVLSSMLSHSSSILTHTGATSMTTAIHSAGASIWVSSRWPSSWHNLIGLIIIRVSGHTISSLITYQLIRHFLTLIHSSCFALPNDWVFCSVKIRLSIFTFSRLDLHIADLLLTSFVVPHSVVVRIHSVLHVWLRRSWSCVVSSSRCNHGILMSSDRNWVCKLFVLEIWETWS